MSYRTTHSFQRKPATEQDEEDLKYAVIMALLLLNDSAQLAMEMLAADGLRIVRRT